MEDSVKTTWTFRAECEADLHHLQATYNLEVVSCMQPNRTEGDVHVTIKHEEPIEDLVRAMQRVPDLHVPIGTLKPTANFDGAFDGPFLSHAYGNLELKA